MHGITNKKKNTLGLHSAHQFEQSKKKNGAMRTRTVPTNRQTYLLLDAEVSGKKRGTAVDPGREQERGHGDE
jgi:hypothetical protein